MKNDHQELGDLIKAGQVIVDVIGKDNPSKTLLLGSDTVKFVDDQLTTSVKKQIFNCNKKRINNYHLLSYMFYQ